MFAVFVLHLCFCAGFTIGTCAIKYTYWIDRDVYYVYREWGLKLWTEITLFGTTWLSGFVCSVAFDRAQNVKKTGSYI